MSMNHDDLNIDVLDGRGGILHEDLGEHRDDASSAA
jgi:uncharacterized protein (DUF779 family)